MITKQKLEDLIMAASAVENDEAVLKLHDAILDADDDFLKESASNFDILFDVWDKKDAVAESDYKARICVRLAERSILDNPVFRNVLNSAVRRLIPPYIVASSVVKAVGARDENSSTRDVAMRLKKLQNLRSTAVVFMQESRTWGKINSIDKVTATIAISPLDSASVSSIPIASALFHIHFFNMTPEMLNMLYPGKNHRSALEYKRIFEKHSLVELSESKISDIVKAVMVPSLMTPEEFATWWEGRNEVPKSAKTSGRQFYDARSILELQTILKPLAESGQVSLSTEAAEKLAKLFDHIRINNDKDIAMLAECISWLASGVTVEHALSTMLAPLRGKAPFWPSVIDDTISFKQMETWGKLPVKLLEGFIHASMVLYTPEELVALGLILPLRCISVLFDSLPSDIVSKTILVAKKWSPDVVLWVWKNRAHLSPYITQSLDMERVVDALAKDGLPKEWLAAQRDLKKHLFDKVDFQKFLLENADSDIPSVTNALQKHRVFQYGEQQSIMVKLARHSAELKAYLEAGEGKKMMGSSASGEDQHPPITSVRSLRRLAEELDNLIKVQIPENAAAVALARSFGDLRENAEYDAAKERRRYLHRRRADLEKTLSFIEGTDFKNVSIKDTVVLGSTAKLKSANGTEKTYYVLGAWDGDPEKDRIAYTTKIGEALIGQKVGSKLNLQDAGLFTLCEVLPLPAEIQQELADETKA